MREIIHIRCQYSSFSASSLMWMDHVYDLLTYRPVDSCGISWLWSPSDLQEHLHDGSGFCVTVWDFLTVYNTESRYLHKFLFFLALGCCILHQVLVHKFLTAWPTSPLGETSHDWKHTRPCVTVTYFSYKAVSGFLITDLCICEEALVPVLSRVSSV